MQQHYLHRQSHFTFSEWVWMVIDIMVSKGLTLGQIWFISVIVVFQGDPGPMAPKGKHLYSAYVQKEIGLCNYSPFNILSLVQKQQIQNPLKPRRGWRKRSTTTQTQKRWVLNQSSECKSVCVCVHVYLYFLCFLYTGSQEETEWDWHKRKHSSEGFKWYKNTHFREKGFPETECFKEVQKYTGGGYQLLQRKCQTERTQKEQHKR